MNGAVPPYAFVGCTETTLASSLLDFKVSRTAAPTLRVYLALSRRLGAGGSLLSSERESVYKFSCQLNVSTLHVIFFGREFVCHY